MAKTTWEVGTWCRSNVQGLSFQVFHGCEASTKEAVLLKYMSYLQRADNWVTGKYIQVKRVVIRESFGCEVIASEEILISE